MGQYELELLSSLSEKELAYVNNTCAAFRDAFFKDKTAFIRFYKKRGQKGGKYQPTRNLVALRRTLLLSPFRPWAYYRYTPGDASYIKSFSTFDYTNNVHIGDKTKSFSNVRFETDTNIIDYVTEGDEEVFDARMTREMHRKISELYSPTAGIM